MVFLGVFLISAGAGILTALFSGIAEIGVIVTVSIVGAFIAQILWSKK